MSAVWFVCQQDYGETTGPIFMKLGGSVTQLHNFFVSFINIVRAFSHGRIKCTYL